MTASPGASVGEGNAELEPRSAGVAFGRDPAAMRFGDGARDGQSHAHAVVLRREERFEEPLELIGRYPGPVSRTGIEATPTNPHHPQANSPLPVRRFPNAANPFRTKIQVNLLN